MLNSARVMVIVSVLFSCIQDGRKGRVGRDSSDEDETTIFQDLLKKNKMKRSHPDPDKVSQILKYSSVVFASNKEFFPLI